jgi:hypothetical protein
METLLGLAVGLGLSAACGFRVFVPLLLAGAAVRTGHLDFAPGFEWMGSNPALIAFGAATTLEIIAYYVPWLDNALDGLATPASVIAGTLATASMVTELDPFMRWTLALIAGGGLAGLVQSGTVFTRGLSSATTGGLANPLVATAELATSILTSILALLAPFLAVTLILILLTYLGWRYWRRPRPSPTTQ